MKEASSYPLSCVVMYLLIYILNSVRYIQNLTNVGQLSLDGGSTNLLYKFGQIVIKVHLYEDGGSTIFYLF
jgi:hypothetical protein